MKNSLKPISYVIEIFRIIHHFIELLKISKFSNTIYVKRLLRVLYNQNRFF